jgi:hypothetical protein
MKTAVVRYPMPPRIVSEEKTTWTDGEYAVIRDRDGRPHVVALDPQPLARSAA